MADGAGAPNTGAAARRPAKRSLLVTIALLLLSALAFWGSSRLTWVEVPPGRLVGGRAVDDLNGADFVGWLVPMAVFTLAAVAAALGLPGQARRVLGAGLALVGLLAVWFAFYGGYEIEWSGSLPGYDGSGDPERTVRGPITAFTGAQLLVVAGVVLVARGPEMPRLGARYSAPGGESPVRDSDEDLWRALSDGEDPTSGS
ncbi:Trp biosynthesis-associated membrane protein [Haloechinothrix salitolerans]|uniref:Trp biosynthesis-associated membrane protein n=1 Tax=Haloechinothrix salitolerans TaxID=926830 RepID=A0ABW2C5Q2_9PSEU